MNIHTLVDRFLTWPLPEGTCADPCASNPDYPHRSGTNLLNADQARQMLEHVLGPPAQPALLGEAYLCDKCQTPFDGAYYCPSCGHNTATKKPCYAASPTQKGGST